jgi:hypothetical protein
MKEYSMRPNSRTTARAVGILFLISYAGFAIGSVLLASSLDPATSLASIGASETQVIIGTLLSFLNVAAILGIAALLFPLLRVHGEGVAVWYVGMRVTKGAAYVTGMIGTLSLLTLSREVIAGGMTADGQVLRAVLVAQGDWAAHLATPPFILGAIALYALLYRSRLVPRFIAVWGLAAVASLTAGNVLAPELGGGFEPAMLLYLPIVANEVFLAVWLIVKGFTASASDGTTTGQQLAAQPAYEA